MLYIIGGAARAGKSIIARSLNENHAIPYFTLDLLTHVLQNFDEKNISHTHSTMQRAHYLWQHVSPLADHMATEYDKYLLESDALLPKNIAKLIDAHPKKIKACFLGYINISPSEKLKKIRENEYLPDSWTKNFSDEKVLEFIKDRIEFSIYIKSECKHYNTPYFETGNDIKTTYKKVENHFLKNEQ